MASLEKAARDSNLREFVNQLVEEFPHLQEVHVLGPEARGQHGQRPDYSVLLFAGYENSVDLMTALARRQFDLAPEDLILHVYVEYYGGAISGVWGGRLIHLHE